MPLDARVPRRSHRRILAVDGHSSHREARGRIRRRPARRAGDARRGGPAPLHRPDGRPGHRGTVHRLRDRDPGPLRRRRRRPRARGAARGTRRVSVHPRDSPRHVPRPPVDDAPVRGLRDRRRDEPPLPLPDRARLDGALDGVRPPDPARSRLGRAAVRRRGRSHRGRDRHDRGHADLLRPDPARRGLDLDDDQCPGRDPAAPLRAGRRGAGDPGGEAPRNGPERRPEGVRRARATTSTRPRRRCG